MRQAALRSVHEMAKADERVVFVGSDLDSGILEEFHQEFPSRFFIEGVSEQHVVGMAAGLALEGYIPFVRTLATFLTRRCYEQIAIDVCLQNLPVRLLADGGGLAFAPLGPTHLAVEDFAILRCLPNMTVLAPCDADEIARLMPQTLGRPGPVYIRLTGEDSENRVVSQATSDCQLGQAVLLKQPGDVLLASTGAMAQPALDAADKLAGVGINAGVLHFHAVKPLDAPTLARYANGVRLVATLEEHVLMGGFGSAVLEALTDRQVTAPRVIRLGLPDEFIEGYGNREYLLRKYGLDPSDIVRAVETAVGAIPLGASPGRSREVRA